MRVVLHLDWSEEVRATPPMRRRIAGFDAIKRRVAEGSDEDLSALRESYKHVVELRDQTISDGIIPPISEWKDYNPNLV